MSPVAPQARAHVGAVPIARHDLRQHIAALAWFDVDASQAARHLGLPSDLFVVAVSCNLEVSVAVLHTRSIRFEAMGRGQLAFALLTPLGLLLALRVPLNGVTDRRIPLAELCGLQEQTSLRDTLLGATGAQERTALFGRWLEERIHRRHGFGAQQGRVAAVASALQHQPDAARLPDLTAQLGITRRQMERDFRKWMGLGPAGYARLVRFQRSARAVASGAPLLDVAVKHHYCDQSHLNRTFRELTGLTPRDLAQQASRPHRLLERRAFADRILMVDDVGVDARSQVRACR